MLPGPYRCIAFLANGWLRSRSNRPGQASKTSVGTEQMMLANRCRRARISTDWKRVAPYSQGCWPSYNRPILSTDNYNHFVLFWFPRRLRRVQYFIMQVLPAAVHWCDMLYNNNIPIRILLCYCCESNRSHEPVIIVLTLFSWPYIHCIEHAAWLYFETT